jgi:heme-degrading monooxygenase HmoA
MYVIIWQFDVEPVHAAEFERTYGPEGSWAEFFRRSADYRGTRLFRDTEIPYRYLTFDYWTSRQAFQGFEREHAAEYQSLDGNFAAFSLHEEHLGAFVTSEGATANLDDHRDV